MRGNFRGWMHSQKEAGRCERRLRDGVHVQKEAGILERGMQAIRQAISSLLGQRGEDKPEHEVCSLILALSLVYVGQRVWRRMWRTLLPAWHCPAQHRAQHHLLPWNAET